MHREGLRAGSPGLTSSSSSEKPWPQGPEPCPSTVSRREAGLPPLHPLGDVARLLPGGDRSVRQPLRRSPCPNPAEQGQEDPVPDARSHKGSPGSPQSASPLWPQQCCLTSPSKTQKLEATNILAESAVRGQPGRTSPFPGSAHLLSLCTDSFGHSQSQPRPT